MSILVNKKRKKGEKMIDLKRIRKEKKLTQQELSQLSGVPQQSISRYEKGSRNADSENLKKLALALRVSADDLLGITEEVKNFKRIQENLSIELTK
ncbi:MAG: helix-turn-helix transcriptional regulator [Spirochaetales bacterium]|nr:helix-turn-helix transcriptional regulator [Spirochaetales bacterium]